MAASEASCLFLRLVISLHARRRYPDCVAVLCAVGSGENLPDMVYNKINGNCKKYNKTTGTKRKQQQKKKKIVTQEIQLTEMTEKQVGGRNVDRHIVLI